MPSLNDYLLIGASQGFLLCVLILSLPSANRAANRLLTLYVGLESLHLLFLHVAYAQDSESTSVAMRLLFNLRVLDGPALYLYVRTLSEPAFHLERRQLLHFGVLGPAVAWVAYLAADANWLGLSTLELQQQPSTVALSAYHGLVVGAYALLARRQLSQHLHHLRRALSELDHVDLQWLYSLVTLLVAVQALHLGLDLLRLAGAIGPQPKIIANLAMTMLLIYLISIGGLRQSKIFTEPVREALASVDVESEDKPQAATAGRERGKYLKSGLDEERKTAIWECLQSLLDNQRPFLEATLSLPQLARLVGVRPQELSEVINTRFDGTFYDLINRSRVEAAKALLEDSTNRGRKMLDIALSVGFSSQSTFYSQFKKLTGVTPTAYRGQKHSQSARTQGADV